METELKKKNTLRKIPNDPILIVEDKQENSILLESLCDELGVKHEVASNGEEALKRIEDKKYSLFILDLMMPVMDGVPSLQSSKRFILTLWFSSRPQSIETKKS